MRDPKPGAVINDNTKVRGQSGNFIILSYQDPAACLLCPCGIQNAADHRPAVFHYSEQLVAAVSGAVSSSLQYDGDVRIVHKYGVSLYNCSIYMYYSTFGGSYGQLAENNKT